MSRHFEAVLYITKYFYTRHTQCSKHSYIECLGRPQTTNVYKTHLRCQKTRCIFARVKSMYIDPTKLHFTATNFSQNILVITNPAEPSRSHSCNQKMCACILADSASAVRYQGTLRSESVVYTRRIFGYNTAYITCKCS